MSANLTQIITSHFLFAAFADYDYETRPESVRKTIDTFANNGIVRKPLISVHGTLDALIPLKGHARPYKAMVEAEGTARIIASMRSKMGIT